MFLSNGECEEKEILKLEDKIKRLKTIQKVNSNLKN